MSKKAKPKPLHRTVVAAVAANPPEPVLAAAPAAPATAPAAPAPCGFPGPIAKAAAVPVLLVFWLLGVANLFHPLLFGRYLGDIGDSRLVLFLLEHQYKLLTDRAYPGTYSTGPFWFPDSAGNMAHSDLLTGGEPVYFLPRLWLSPEHAYQAFFLIAATLNFLAFFWLCRSLGVRSPAAAALAAWVFAFGMHKVQHTVHGQLYIEFWGVAFWGCLLRFLRSPARPALFGAVLFLGLQALTSPYTGVFYAIGALFFTAAYWLAVSRAVLPQIWKFLRGDFFGALGAVTAGALPAVLLLAPYWTPEAGLARSWKEVFPFTAGPGYWFLPLQGSPWWWMARLAGQLPPPHETYFLGAVFWLLALGALAAWAFAKTWRAGERGRLAAVSVLAALALLLLVAPLGPDRALWRVFFDWFPGAKGIRDIRRIGIVANLGLLLAGALFLDELARRAGDRLGRALLYGCAALALLENCPFPGLVHRLDASFSGMYSYPRSWYRPQNAEIAGLLAGARAAYLYPDPQLPDFAHEYNAQLTGQQLDIPVMNGASGFMTAHTAISPREALAKGLRFDFEGFRYLAPVSAEAALAEPIRQAGLSLFRRGKFFAAYEPYGPDPHYDAEFRLLDPAPPKLHPGQEIPLLVEVTNRCNFPWQPVGVHRTEAGFQVFDAQRMERIVSENYFDFPAVVFPGEQSLVAVRIQAPAASGSYLVRLAMIQQGLRRFNPVEDARRIQFPLTVE
jgi:hypothetical protein